MARKHMPPMDPFSFSQSPDFESHAYLASLPPWNSLRIVVMGTGPFAVPMFAALCQSGQHIVAVVTRPDHAAAGRRPAKNPMREAAVAAGLPVFDPEHINTPEAITSLAQWSPDLLVVCDYGQILSGELVDTNANNIPDCCDAGISCDPCLGDISGDGEVNGVEIAILMDLWATSSEGNFDADLNNDGTVSGADLSIVLDRWGECP